MFRAQQVHEDASLLKAVASGGGKYIKIKVLQERLASRRRGGAAAVDFHDIHFYLPNSQPRER